MTSEKEPNETETSNPVTRDIAREFNAIVDSVDEQSEFIHDRYFRFAFAKPERMAELLKLFSSDKHTGSADLVFEANLKNGGVTGLYVGIIAEHKSTSKDKVLLQISEYYHHLYLERKKDVPVVAFIVYNGEDEWNPLLLYLSH